MRSTIQDIEQLSSCIQSESMEVRRAIPAQVQSILHCPSCRGTLAENKNSLVCHSCNRIFPFVKGVVRFVEAESYASSFGFQWHKYARTQLDNEATRLSEVSFRRKTGFTPEELAGKLVLDVGCGMGRYAEVASRWGAHVVGIDLSNAVEVAAQNLAERKSVTILQADVFSLPFAPESFDFIYSIGVLHHTSDCERAFKSLPPLLKAGGSIAIWLYSSYNNWYRFSDLYRKVTHRLPVRWLHALCYAAVPLYYIHRGLRLIPVVGRPLSGLLRYVLPTSLDPDPARRILDTFDWYSPKFQSKHRYEEVFPWFEESGLDSLHIMPAGQIAVRGRKPLSRNQRA